MRQRSVLLGRAWAPLWCVGLIGSAFAPLFLGAAVLAAEPPPTGAASIHTVVLSAGSLWRKHYTFFPPLLSAEAAAKAGVAADPAARAKYLVGWHPVPSKARVVFGVGGGETLTTGVMTAPPPVNWAVPEFDDSGWLNVPGVEFTGLRASLVRPARGGWSHELPAPSRARIAALRGTDPFVKEVGLICMRGAFRIEDRAQVKRLQVSLTYRGGFVLYVNGKEIARASLPAGNLEPATPAETYPLEAFCGPGGEPALDPWISTDFEFDALEHNWAARERRSGPISIAPALLRNGVNVIALELHRSDYPAECRPDRLGPCFGAVGLGEFSLEADAAPGALMSSTTRPKGLAVWNAETWQDVRTGDFGNAAQPLAPIRITATRNGAFAGQVVVGSPEAIEGLQVRAGALTNAGGKGVIPAEAIRIRYRAVSPTRRTPRFSWLDGLSSPRFDAVLDRAPDRIEVAGEETVENSIAPWAPIVRESLGLPPGAATAGAVVPVWLTVSVPKDAAAGDYHGEVAITAKGAPTITVPLELHVAAWTLPDPKDFASLIFIYQSPDTLAEYYKVEPWSEAHWKLIDRSLELLGGIGNAGIVLPLLAQTQFGNSESLVRWIPERDGAWKYDFTLFDRYVDTALKYHDPRRLKVVGLEVWFRQMNETNNAFVTVLDPATGKRDKMKLPPYGSPECEAMWRPLLTALRERLQKRGLADALMFGMADDVWPKPEHVAMFNAILPGTPWFIASHGGGRTLPADPRDRAKTVRFGCESMVYGSAIPDPKAKRLYGWQPKPGQISLRYNRENTPNLPLADFPEPWAYHMWMESSLAAGLNGSGHIGGDYFLFSNGNCIFSRYPTANVTNLGLVGTTPDLLQPGPDGPVASVRFENAREGIQESEARISIEKALLDQAHALPPDLAKKCQDLLDERTTAMRIWTLNSLLWHWRRGTTEMGALNWRESNQRLFDLAAQVAKEGR